MPQRAKKHSRPQNSIKAKAYNLANNTMEYTFVRPMSGPERAAARRAKVGAVIVGHGRTGTRANGRRRPRRARR